MGLARKNEGCRALETDANQILIGLVRKVTLSPKQNGVVGGLHLPFSLSQGARMVFAARNPGIPEQAGSYVPLVPHAPHSHMGTLRLQAWLGGGLPWVTEQGMMTLAG